MAILDFLISVLVASLAGMGIGGGGLLVIWLVLVREMPSQSAQAVNLVFFVVSAVCALPIHLKRRSLDAHRILFLTASAIPGVWVGCQLASVLPETAARRCFGYFLLLSGIMQAYRQIKAQFFS